MSLINDALKRARQVQTQAGTTPAAETPLQPVVHPLPSRESAAWLPRAAAVIILMGGLWSLGLWWRGAQTTAAPAPPRDEAAESAKAAAEIAAAFSAKAASAVPSRTAPPPVPHHQPAMAEERVAQPAAPRRIAAAPTPVSVPTERASRPEALNTDTQPAVASSPVAAFKLQGIFYRLSNASVLINNQTLYLGDEIDGAKLVGIERSSVRILLAGKTHVLKLR
jgi:hypothetical protein